MIGELRCGVGSVTSTRECLTIQHDQRVLLQVRIPERHLSLLHGRTTASFTSLSGENSQFIEVGRSPSLDPHTRSLLIQYQPESDAPLQGSSGRATVRTEAVAGLQVVPLAALTRMDGNETVFVHGEDGAEARQVRVHARDGEIAVVEGLEGVKEVATRGVFLLKSMASLEDQ